MISQEEIVQKQLLAYNAKDADMFSKTYAENAVQYSFDGFVLASGRTEIKNNIEKRFLEPDLFAELIERHIYDNIVIDHEKITRNFPEGVGSVEMLCIYVVEAGLIQRGTFKVYNKQLINRSN